MRHALKNIEPLIIILALGLALPESTLADTGSAVCAQPTMSLVPVKASGPYMISGNEIMVEPGAQVWLEIQVCGWDPDLDGEPQIKTWQAKIDPSGYESGLTGYLTAYVPDCTTDAECETMVGPGSFCVGWGSYVNRCAPAFQDFQQDPACPAGAGCLDLGVSVGGPYAMMFGSTDLSGPATDDGQAHYGGTAVFEVSADASGTFTIGFDQADSWLRDTTNAWIGPLTHVPALITIPGGCCLDGTGCQSVDFVTCQGMGGTPVGPACQGDCNGNGIDDVCEGFADCNGNGTNDECDIDTGFSEDCNANDVPDECDPDCNDNGVPDACDLTAGTSEDCNANGVPDECDLETADCNGNGVPDDCDITTGTSEDCDANGVPDECPGVSWDCNNNGVPDVCDLTAGTSEDCNANAIPDECDDDCNHNGIPNDCDLANGTSQDCDGNGWPDECIVGSIDDCNHNLIPDECETLPLLLSSTPPNATIDARQPSAPDGSNPGGYETVELVLDSPAGPLTPEDFTVESTSGIPPIISEVSTNANTVIVQLAGPIPAGAWTAISHNDSCVSVCLGFLPGDVNGDGTSSAADILYVIDNLNGQMDPPYELHRCDTDRSGSCGASDILRVIDLLNGANQYESWLGRRLPDCPAGG